jgi:hypothetical protein
MRRPTITSARAAGVLYVIASLGFLIVFSWLAARFGYPDVLDGRAPDVLPRLLALGGAGRAVWVVYAVLPLLLIPAAVGAAAALRTDGDVGPPALDLAVLLQVVSSLAMTLGLARWSTAQWVLAEAWPHADASQRVALAAIFDALNAYLGNGIGEFVGELALYGSISSFGAVLANRGAWRMAGFAGVAALAGWIGMFRNMTTLVQPAADLSNLLLPVFLIAFGVSLVCTRGN